MIITSSLINSELSLTLFLLTISPVCEKVLSESAEEAGAAKYLHAKEAKIGYLYLLILHQVSGSASNYELA